VGERWGKKAMVECLGILAMGAVCFGIYAKGVSGGEGFSAAGPPL
jgi:hypothetical protein